MSAGVRPGQAGGAGQGPPPELASRTIFEESRPGRMAVSLPEPGVPSPGAEALLPAWARRAVPPALPEVGELQLVRHYTRLSQKNLGIDTTFYPLGSCTMKYNPRLNEQIAALPGLADIHPYQDPDQVQGALELFYELEQLLAQLTGLEAVSLQPAAGAHGELTGLMCIRAWHVSRGEAARRTRVLIPDSAHGTNPASVTLCGMEAVPVRTADNGRVHLADLERKLDERVAAFMITNPSTLGLFESELPAMAERLHAAGALVYLDGANLNAMLGVIRPGDLGVDVMHVNLHKTLSTPHGGGGPGSGPIAVRSFLEPFLPVPRIVRGEDGRLRLETDRPQSIGRVKAFLGHAGMVWRAYAYLRAHSGRDLAGVAKHAVLNANYIRVRLRDHYEVAYPGMCMHEVVLSARRQKRLGASALDIAKGLLDRGFHPPTIYFPLIVPEALMIEPTETETRETLDRFCDAMIELAELAARDPEQLRQAPRTLPVRRLDEVRAARQPVLRWRAEPAPADRPPLAEGDACAAASAGVPATR
ncbi:MAG: putative glycine dehydrogenase (decarboxylating) subunit 2 [Planctomycetota bacterium]|nr:MAG: putative glycine dehydrogenase (decarboxylating) subunit 2 [Planctomycetota bacterium]